MPSINSSIWFAKHVRLVVWLAGRSVCRFVDANIWHKLTQRIQTHTHWYQNRNLFRSLLCFDYQLNYIQFLVFLNFRKVIARPLSMRDIHENWFEYVPKHDFFSILIRWPRLNCVGTWWKCISSSSSSIFLLLPAPPLLLSMSSSQFWSSLLAAVALGWLLLTVRPKYINLQQLI